MNTQSEHQWKKIEKENTLQLKEQIISWGRQMRLEEGYDGWHKAPWSIQ